MPAIVPEGLSPVVPETVVIARHQQRHAVAVTQQLDELRRVEFGKFRGEVKLQQQVGTKGLDLFQSLIKRHDELERLIGMENLTWMAQKGNQQRLFPLVGCLLLEEIDQRGMSEMDSVKHAYCSDSAARRQAVVFAQYLHSVRNYLSKYSFRMRMVSLHTRMNISRFLSMVEVFTCLSAPENR